MKVIRYTDADYAEAIQVLDRRAVPADPTRESVEQILRDVRARGDDALV